MIGDSALVTKFCQAKHYTKGPRSRGSILWLVLHTAETPEDVNRAEWLCEYCRTNDRVASWHFSVDSDSATQSVREADIAYAAKSANARGIHIEHAGRAAQDASGWNDAYSKAMLRMSAKLAADICKRNAIPVRFVDAAGLKRGDAGITTHAEVSRAWPSTGHTDPGPNFPMEQYLAWVREAGSNEEDDLPYTEAQLTKIIADAIAPLAAETAALGRLVEKLEIRTRLNYVKDGATVETIGTDVKALHDALPDG